MENNTIKDSTPEKIATNFKKKGYFDNIKKEIINNHKSISGNQTIQEYITESVTKFVQDMVYKDHSLLFKNNKATSMSLIESKYFKANKPNIDELIKTTITDNSEVKKIIEAQLQELVEFSDPSK
ncbi:Shg1p SCDLUD_004671 [Saccharomycodes ludwigii]|uniref:Shg1p n=1 Tax=Saccharomycodes ludwigii TaxID=36035 RepID=UPI001E83AC07|nr:hypothetical protein SCDLUD_004671 [Saccharomycodes ludwigii]KAH3899238.1 hypothetical protein SCDLUD_004671 [Saccharomycodes ludwigii]